MIASGLSRSLEPLNLKKTVGLRATTRFVITFILVPMVISPPILIFDPSTASALVNPTTTTTTPSTIGQDGSDFTTQATLGSVSARPTNNIVNTNSFYDIVFITATSGTIKRIQVTFPAGTAVPTGASFNEAEGIGPGTVRTSGQTITYTVTNAVNVPAGTKIRLEFANINNPQTSSTNYKVTVTTRNAANTVIDGPTQSIAYKIKQMGTADIADDAITTNKIADGAISPKGLQRSGELVDVNSNSFGVAVVGCIAPEVIQGGGFGSNSDGLLNVVSSFAIDTDGDGLVDAWRVAAFNPSSNTDELEPIALCGLPAP